MSTIYDNRYFAMNRLDEDLLVCGLYITFFSLIYILTCRVLLPCESIQQFFYIILSSHCSLSTIFNVLRTHKLSYHSYSYSAAFSAHEAVIFFDQCFSS